MEILKNHVANYNKAMAEKKYSQVASIAEIIMNYCAKKLKENPNSQFAQTFKDKYNSAKEFYDNYKAGKYSNSNIAGGASNTERPKTNWFSDEVPNLKISDIAGLQKLKNEFIINIFAPFDPVYGPIYRKYRSDIGLQVLLYGPPGTGKTFAVKCLAGELGCKIAVVQVKDIMSKYVGEGAKMVSEVFEQAKDLDRCIIFFDEIDSIATSRDDDESKNAKEQFTQLLTNMDGFTAGTKPGQLRIVIAATNRPWALDSAILRGGRFETKIYMPLPDNEARVKLISDAFGMEKGAKLQIPVANDVTAKAIAPKFEGYSGADIKAACRQIASKAMVREITSARQKNHTPDCVKMSDVDAVLKDYIVATTDEDILNFEAYSRSMDANSYIEMVIKDIEDNKNTSYASPQVLRYAKKVIEFRKRINK